MKNICVIILAIALFFCACHKADSGINKTPDPYTMPETLVDWVLDFQDDFNGSTINQDVWGLYDNSYSDNPEHIRRPEAIQVKDGLLTLLVDKHPTDPNRFMTGGVAHKKGYKYAKFEFRIRMDQDTANATSGICLTWPDSEKWPNDGELDIYETEYDSQYFSTWVHWGTANSNNIYQDNKYQKTHYKDKSQWRVIALEWSPEYLKVYFDGELQWTLKDPAAIPKEAHHICFQTEKNFTLELPSQIKLQIDWVKVYKRVEKK